MSSGTRGSKRKRKAEIVELSPERTEEPVAEEKTKVRKKSGYPFIDEEVEWTYERLELLPMARKVIPAGYETLAGDVNTLLTKKMSVSNANIVRNSSMGQFTRLDASTIRCGRMMHYVVCHQVVPEPNFDPTALFFKFGRKVLRFSRVEYALVSGLKFGPSTFDPYGEQTLPPNSTYERLFGANPGTRLSDVRTSFVDRTFKVKGKEVETTPEDWVTCSTRRRGKTPCPYSCSSVSSALGSSSSHRRLSLEFSLLPWLVWGRRR